MLFCCQLMRTADRTASTQQRHHVRHTVFEKFALPIVNYSEGSGHFWQRQLTSNEFGTRLGSAIDHLGAIRGALQARIGPRPGQRGAALGSADGSVFAGAGYQRKGRKCLLQLY